MTPNEYLKIETAQEAIIAEAQSKILGAFYGIRGGFVEVNGGAEES